ncbi:hypothetical protein ILYODFUR_038425 [Ilyodon furcidens]|uniref:Uncharacterized protein n=1 Tax=Ilyodon furcidens TaxID=33524 RepID=A0ABV0U163_9TELE
MTVVVQSKREAVLSEVPIEQNLDFRRQILHGRRPIGSSSERLILPPVPATSQGDEGESFLQQCVLGCRQLKTL